jgi:hypothetical protein
MNNGVITNSSFQNDSRNSQNLYAISDAVRVFVCITTFSVVFCVVRRVYKQRRANLRFQSNYSTRATSELVSCTVHLIVKNDNRQQPVNNFYRWAGVLGASIRSSESHDTDLHAAVPEAKPISGRVDPSVWPCIHAILCGYGLHNGTSQGPLDKGRRPSASCPSPRRRRFPPRRAAAARPIRAAWIRRPRQRGGWPQRSPTAVPRILIAPERLATTARSAPAPWPC